MKFAYLIMVDGSNGKNNNKFYKMTELSDGTFEVSYGRVDSTSTTVKYPIGKWNSKYNSKIKKGYKDITELVSQPNDDQDNIECENGEVNEAIKLVIKLQSYAKNTINKHYNISYRSVTQKMVDTAQNILNDIVHKYNSGASMDEINVILMNLYTTIPRKMKNVSDFLLKTNSKENFNCIIDNEQKLLDAMAGQVMVHTKSHNSKDNSSGLLEKMGINVVVVNDNDVISSIKNLMGSSSDMMGQVYEVTNFNTENEYNKVINGDANSNEVMLWHGSRNQNWFNILQTGLLIRPTGAIHNGSMFSDGIYFANKARKSIGYTSINGSYWARGNDNVSYLALFKVNVGNQKHIYKHDSSCYNINESNLMPYNSVYAHGGVDLVNDEFIIYNPNRCTIRYLVEIIRK